jgi:hypothetical protein
MGEQIFTAVVRCNEAIPFCIVEPFHSACCHIAIPHKLRKLPEKVSGDCLNFKGCVNGGEYCETGPTIELEAKHLCAF